MILLISKILILAYTAFVISAICMNAYLKKVKKLTGIGWKECFNPFKMLSVVIGFTLWVIIPMHIFEQYVLRFYDDQCRPTCLLGNKGNCISCGCNTKAKMWSPLEKDSKNNWGKIIFSKKAYIELRKKYPINIKIEI